MSVIFTKLKWVCLLILWMTSYFQKLASMQHFAKLWRADLTKSSGFILRLDLASREFGEAWHNPSEGRCDNDLSVSLKGDYSNDCGLPTNAQSPNTKAWHNQQASVLFSWTPSSISDDWKRWLIRSMCCQNIKGRGSHSTLLGRAEALSWCSTKPSEADSGKVENDLVAFSPNGCFLCAGLRALKGFSM